MPKGLQAREREGQGETWQAQCFVWGSGSDTETRGLEDRITQHNGGALRCGSRTGTVGPCYTRLQCLCYNAAMELRRHCCATASITARPLPGHCQATAVPRTGGGGRSIGQGKFSMGIISEGDNFANSLNPEACFYFLADGA